MKRSDDSIPNRSRSRKKAAAPPVETPEPSEFAPAITQGDKNVGPVESGISTAAGVLFLVVALFPRTLKQLLLLGFGGFLVFRGVKNKCNVYSALGIDTVKEPLLKQINEKYLAPVSDS